MMQSKYKSMATDRKNTGTIQPKHKFKRIGHHLLLILSAVIILALLSLVLFVWWAGYWPANVETVKIYKRHYTGQVSANQRLSVMSYNVKFMESNETNFFFYGEDNESWTSQDSVIATINNIAKIIDDNNPDIILLQEVDIDSKRTYNINQIDALLNKISSAYQYWACTPYWKSKIIPNQDIWGSVNMQLCTISKYPITAATRYALPNNDGVNIIARQFIPKRAILATAVTINGKVYQLYNLHLSPFAKHNNPSNPQLKIVEDLIEHHSDNLFIVGGDFNMLPDKKFIPYIPEIERKHYEQEDQHFKNFFTKYQSIPSLQDLNSSNFKNYFTFMGTGSSDTPPDRTLDYFFIPKNMKVIDYKVINNDLSAVLSDHLPIMVTVEL